MSRAHIRRSYGKLPREALAARPVFVRNATKQPTAVRELRLQAGARETGRPGATL